MHFFQCQYALLTQLSADEKVGELLVLAILAETKVGRQILIQ
jgi:hypothetical protein